ncbi:MAG TPA: carboxypeptidase-like regulatory domain-containing protein, partial [Oceanipulchritudo sp.]|nr:carboxypeptidase-like regulatory domain-containing protein [Oceanipulchritudo sp.]
MLRNRAFRIVCLLIIALPGLLHGQATISGLVRNSVTSVPLAGIDLDVYDLSGTRVTVTGALTAADGTFTITVPGPGGYHLRADLPNGSPLADQYYNGAFLPSQATAINVPTSSSQVSGINFNLLPGYAILGRVTTTGGLSAADVDLDLYAGNGEFLGGYPARTAADGTFTIGALPSGSYYLKADPDPALQQYLVFRFFGGTQDIVTATPINVNGASVTGINWSLPEGGIITGLVESIGGTPLADIDFDVYDINDNRLPYNGKSLLDGTYAVGPMPAGFYKLRADPFPEQGYVRAFFGNGIDQGLAVAVEVRLSQTTNGIDFSLEPGGTISGLVTAPGSGTPVAGIDLDIFDANGLRVDLTARTDLNGRYVLGALPTGSYLVRADPAIDSGFAGVYFGGNNAPSSALPVNVVAGLDTGNISMQLPPGGWLTGTIRDSIGNPVPGIDLDAFDTAGSRLYPTARSALDGTYTMGPFPAGGVVVRADPDPTAGLAHQYYLNSDDRLTATAVQVPVGTSAGGVDFSLQPAGWISGTIRDAFGFPLAGIDLDLYDALADNRVLGGGTSGLDGSYLIGPLNYGSYHLRADPTTNQSYVRSYYNGAQAISAALAIVVNTTTGNTGVDFSLAAGRSLSGTVQFANLQPAVGIDMDVINVANGKRREQTAKTDAAGHFVLPPIPHGTYLLRADPLDAQPYLDTYFVSTPFIASATPIVVDAAAALDQLDITLWDYVTPAINRPGNQGSYILLSNAGANLEFTIDAPSGAITEFRISLGGLV